MLGALLASTAVTPAFADITNWNGTGSWSTPGNWSLGIPVPGDEARVQSGTLIVDTSVETLKGWIYGTAQATVQSGWAVANDFGVENAGTLDVQSGGTMQVGEDLFLQSGTVRVGGANASLAVAADFVVGRDAAPSTIIIENGGQLTTGRSFVGEGHNTVDATSISMRVSGAGSVWNAGSYLAMGGSDTMVVQGLVEDGGLLTAQAGAIGRGGKAALTITGAQSELRVNGPSPLATSSTAMTARPRSRSTTAHRRGSEPSGWRTTPAAPARSRSTTQRFMPGRSPPVRATGRFISTTTPGWC